MGALTVSWLVWDQLFNTAADRTPQTFAFPAGAAAALLDGRPLPEDQRGDPSLVLCLSVEGRSLQEILPLRRHDRRMVVDPQECGYDAHGSVIHKSTGVPAAFARYFDFKPTDLEHGTAKTSFHCDPECGGTWDVALSGADDIGWWVIEEKNLRIY